MVKSPGEITQTTTPKQRLAKIFLSRSHFFILCGRLRLEINHSDSEKTSVSSEALRQRSSCSVCPVNPAGPKNSGKATRAPHSLDFFADVSFFRPRGRILRQKTRAALQKWQRRSTVAPPSKKRRRLVRNGASTLSWSVPFSLPWLSIMPNKEPRRHRRRGQRGRFVRFARHHYNASAQEVDPGGGETEATLPKWHGRSITSPPLVGVSPERQNSAGQMSRAIPLWRHLVRMCRARCFFALPGEAVPPSKKQRLRAYYGARFECCSRGWGALPSK